MLFAAAPVIDVMVLYTPQALSQAGGLSALDYRIQRSISDTNMAMANSQVAASLRLVNETLVNYTESGVTNTDLNALQSGTGAFSGVPALRDQFGADLVSLWVSSGSGDEAGRAFQPTSLTTPDPTLGYNVIQEQYADNNYVFAHEVGHNLGAGHDASDTSPRAIPYAYGKTFALGNYSVGDIMSENGDRIPYYSNPNVSFRGIPTGNPDNSAQPADNAEVMNQFASIVASYEPTKYVDTTPPAAAIEAEIADPVAHTVTFQVEYSDDTAVSVGGLGTGDVIVTGPNNFSQAATFVGIDVNSDGPQRVATYQLSTGGATVDPSQYQISLAPGRLRDVAGNFAPGMVLGNPAGSSFPDRAGPRLVSAYDAGTIDNTTRQFSNTINADSPTAFYRFNVSGASNFTATLSGLTDTVNELLVQDQNADGQIQANEYLAAPQRVGTTPETISLALNAGTYFLWVAPPTSNISSTYTLTMTSTLTQPSPPPPPPPPPPPSSVIVGNVFNDANADGALSPGETGLAGWQVYLDLNNKDQLQTGDPTATTDAAGNYQFSGLAAGSYIVRVAPQLGWRQTTLTVDWAQHVAVAQAQTVTGVSFGETMQAAILGKVFNDANGNGVLNSGEVGLGGWVIYLDTNSDGTFEPTEPAVTSDALGNFSFGNLAPGAYTVRLVAPSGWTTTTPAGGSFQVTLVNGGVVGGLLIGAELV